MKWFGLATLLGCNVGKNTHREGSIVSGPFEICWKVTESRSGAWFNNGGDFNAKQYTSWFEVKYQGKQVRVPAFDPYWGSSLAGTKKGKPVKYFWQALFLKEAPHPAVIVGIHSMHLITEENGQLVITPLNEQDNGFATFQFLDGYHGQPGEMKSVYLGDDSDSSRFLSGGRYLMINSKVILDVQTLKMHRFDPFKYEDSQTKLDGYNATNSFAFQISPQKTQILMIGSRPNPTNTLLNDQYAIVAVDFKRDQAYAVPFNRTDTQFFSIWDVNQKWFDTYFEWTTDTVGEDLLRLRHYKKRPYWQGRWTRSEETGEIIEYKLMPVEASMVPAFVNFIKKEIPVDHETTERDAYDDPYATEDKFTTTVNLISGKDDLILYFHPGEQYLNLRSINFNYALIRQLGERFDQEMLKGKFQEHFGRFE